MSTVEHLATQSKNETHLQSHNCTSSETPESPSEEVLLPTSPLRNSSRYFFDEHAGQLPSNLYPAERPRRFLIDLENAFNLENNSVLEISGVRHAIHIDHEEQQVVAIPLQVVEPEVESDALDLKTLASLVGRKGAGRPRKDAVNDALISLVILARNTTVLVQVPVDEIPPTLRLSYLCERVLRTIVESQPCEEQLNSSLSVETDLGPLTLNVNLAVLEGSVDWLESVKVVPVYKSDQIENPQAFKELSMRSIDDDPLHCTLCSFYTFYEPHYSHHLRTEHLNNPICRKLSLCKRCDLTLAGNKGLFEHYIRRHPELTCETCGIMVDKVYQMRRHNERHDDTARNKCELCGNIYKDQYILRSHIKSVHEDSKVFYKCAICSKQFERKAHLVRHMKTHGKEKPYVCQHCDYKTAERGDLNKHLLVHSEPSFKCGICSKLFTHKKSLKLHEKRHEGVRDFKCGLCDFYGYTYNHIKKHIDRMHSKSYIEVV